MSQSLLVEFADFAGGHWGALGADAAAKAQWGGINMIPTRQGGVAHASASRLIDVTDMPNGKMWGMFYAWGVDGKLYFVQSLLGGDAGNATFRRFTPDPSTPQSLESWGAAGDIPEPTALPDWVAFGTSIYCTLYGDKTYAINPGGPSAVILTGSDGDAPAGRSMCVYRDRMIIGGISDGRFGSFSNRIYYSGSSADDVPFDVTRWPSTQFIDFGASDGTFVAGLYPLRDQLVIVMSDAALWTLTGVPGVNENVRRMTGFQKGSGALTTMLHTHAAVDPSQNRLWLFDHSRRGPSRFNGATVVAIPGWGVPMANRTGEGFTQGATVAMGGPDEFLMDHVALPRVDGGPVDGEHVLLLRTGGQFALVSLDVIAGSVPEGGGGDGPFDSLSESFDKADGSIGPDLTWEQGVNSDEFSPLFATIDVSGDEGHADMGLLTLAYARAVEELSSDDQSVQFAYKADSVSTQARMVLCARSPALGDPDSWMGCYALDISTHVEFNVPNDSIYVQLYRISGSGSGYSHTSLGAVDDAGDGTNYDLDPAQDGDVFKLTVETVAGNVVVKGYRNDVQIVQATDSSGGKILVGKGVGFGFRATGGSPYFIDDFAAAIL